MKTVDASSIVTMALYSSENTWEVKVSQLTQTPGEFSHLKNWECSKNRKEIASTEVNIYANVGAAPKIVNVDIEFEKEDGTSCVADGFHISCKQDLMDQLPEFLTYNRQETSLLIAPTSVDQQGTYKIVCTYEFPDSAFYEYSHSRTIMVNVMSSSDPTVGDDVLDRDTTQTTHADLNSSNNCDMLLDSTTCLKVNHNNRVCDEFEFTDPSEGEKEALFTSMNMFHLNQQGDGNGGQTGELQKFKIHALLNQYEDTDGNTIGKFNVQKMSEATAIVKPADTEAFLRNHLTHKKSQDIMVTCNESRLKSKVVIYTHDSEADTTKAEEFVCIAISGSKMQCNSRNIFARYLSQIFCTAEYAEHLVEKSSSCSFCKYLKDDVTHEACASINEPVVVSAAVFNPFTSPNGFKTSDESTHNCKALDIEADPELGFDTAYSTVLLCTVGQTKYLVVIDHSKIMNGKFGTQDVTTRTAEVQFMKVTGDDADDYFKQMKDGKD